MVSRRIVRIDNSPKGRVSLGRLHKDDDVHIWEKTNPWPSIEEEENDDDDDDSVGAHSEWSLETIINVFNKAVLVTWWS
jgi:hypothetical protein